MILTRFGISPTVAADIPAVEMDWLLAMDEVADRVKARNEAKQRG